MSRRVSKPTPQSISVRTVCDGRLRDCGYKSEVIHGTKDKGLGPSGEEKLWSHLLGTTPLCPHLGPSQQMLSSLALMVNSDTRSLEREGLWKLVFLP